MKFSTLGLKTAALVILTICACGGGGGDEAPVVIPASPGPPAPTLSLAPVSFKTLHFSWADVGSQTEYRLLEDPTGSSGYTQVAAIAADATSYDHAVFLPGRVNARYILQACNSEGCNDSAPAHVTGSLVNAVGYAKASSPGVQDQFGSSVALSQDGSTLAVGAYGEASSAVGIDGDQIDDSAAGSGAVYIFFYDGDSWSQQAYVKASNAEAGDHFGWSVALSADGSTLAVGAYGEDSAAAGVNGNQADNSALDSGAVYVFVRTASVWSQQAYIKASNTELDDLFGYSIALSADGNTLAVGAYQEDSIATGIGGDQADNSAPNGGAVYLFARSGSVWSPHAYVKASNTEQGDRFGYSVALSGDGNTLAVGAWREDSAATGIDGNQVDDSALDSGAVYVLVRSGSTWSQQAYIKSSNSEADDRFGYAVALSGDGSTLVVGANWEDSSATGINGNGADNSALDSGAVYVFTRSGSAWSQQAYIKASNTEASDQFGCSIALSSDGDTLGVGACAESSSAVGLNGNQADNSAAGSGAVYVFTRSSGIWGQQAYVKASNTGAGDNAGTTIALSSDGNSLAVGAPGEDSSAAGTGGNQADNTLSRAGAVYLY